MSDTAANEHLAQASLHFGADEKTARVAVLALHGRGGSPADMRSIADRVGLDDVAYAAPAAAGNTWYPLGFLAPFEDNAPYLGWALETVDAAVDDLRARGFSDDKIVLLGFSQGACLLAEWTLTHPSSFAGVVILTGGYIGPADAGQTFDAGRFDGVPVLLATASEDPWVPLTRVHETASVFAELGADVQVIVEPGDVHQITDEAISAARAVIAGVGR